jgi:hypothetical protein
MLEPEVSREKNRAIGSRERANTIENTGSVNFKAIRHQHRADIALNKLLKLGGNAEKAETLWFNVTLQGEIGSENIISTSQLPDTFFLGCFDLKVFEIYD